MVVNWDVHGSDRNGLVSCFITYFRDLQPTCIWVITHLLSTMDIPVGFLGDHTTQLCGLFHDPL